MKHRSKFFQKHLIREVLLFSGLVLGISLVSFFVLFDYFRKDLQRTQKMVAYSIEALVESELLLNNDPAKVQTLINLFQQIEGVSYVLVLNEDFELIAHTYIPDVPSSVRRFIEETYADFYNLRDVRQYQTDEGQVFIDVSAPILGGLGGYVHVGLDRSMMYSPLKRALFSQGFVLFLFFILSVWLAYLAAKSFSEPLLQLTEYAQKVAARDFSSSARIDSDDELGVLASTMDSMRIQLKESFETLEGTLGYLTSIIDNMADGLLVTDQTGKVMRCNPAFCQMFQVDKEVLLGGDCRFVLPDSFTFFIEECQKDIHQTVSKEISLPENRIAKGVAKGISHQWHSQTSIASIAKEGLNGTVILIRDITREKEIDLMKSQFVATVSHELRTPLTSILGFSKIIKRNVQKISKDFNEEQLVHYRKDMGQVLSNVDIIHEESVRLTHLIEDLLNLSKMESGDLALKKEEVQLEDLAKKAIQAYSSIFSQGKVSLDFAFSEDLPSVCVDPDKIKQVMINLIANAHKFTHEGYVKLRIFKDGQDVLVSVEDSGVGIAQENQEKIFEKFHQIDQIQGEKPKGTGLGLAICREIVEIHGGKIWLESDLSLGSRFFFSLPVFS